MSGFRYHLQQQQQAQEEFSFPSFIPDNKTYAPTSLTLAQGGISVVNGIVVLDNIVRETDV